MKNKVRIVDFLRRYGRKIGLDLTYFVKNGFWVAARQAIAAISALSVSVAFARLSSQEVFGQYQFVLSFLAVVSVISLPGLNTSIIRSVSKGFEGDYRRAVRTSFLWSLIGIPILLVIGGYFYVSQSHALGIAIMLSSVFFPFFYAPNTWDSFLQGKHRFDVSAKYAAVQSTISAIAVITVIFLGRTNLIAVIVAYLASYTFFNCYYYVKSLRYVSNERKDEDAISYGWFLTKMTFLGTIAENLDKIIIGIFISPSALAAYYVVSFLPLKAKDFMKPFFGLFLPKFSTMNGSIDGLVKQKKAMIIKASFLIAIMVIAYYFLIEWVNLLVFGSEYAAYYSYSKYYSVLLLLFVPLNILGKYVLAVKDKTTLLLSNVAYPIVRSILNVVFIYKLGILGAVVAYNVNTILNFSLYLVGMAHSRKKKN
ncbi:MAG: Polysaccharide biosynthesis protein [Candidatus Moranbacteria bacterium GW2011_GWE1_49_15]|nr:MAG: Polysaccharide biosynthesis protein [Candidatus Moranbacteria bacterium GW2011_GWE1_49_15]